MRNQVIEGWFCVTKGYPDLSNSLFLNQDVFKLSARCFDLNQLTFINMQKRLGTLMNNVELQAVVDLKGSLIPFFIEKEKAKKLKNLICNKL